MDHVVELPTGAHAPVEARRALVKVPGISGEIGYKALLLVSEVVTAWVPRAQARRLPAIPLRVNVSDDRVRVEITDDGNSGEPSRGIPVDSYSRRILQRTADRWGLESNHGAMIWFELDRGGVSRVLPGPRARMQ